MSYKDRLTILCKERKELFTPPEPELLDIEEKT